MLKQRVITATIMLPVALIITFLLPINIFSVITGLIVVLAAWEWANLSHLTTQTFRIMYAIVTGLLIIGSSFFQSTGFLLGIGLAWWIMAIMLIISYPESKSAWQSRVVKLILGWLVLIPAWAGLVTIRNQEYGSYYLLYLFGIVWMADIAAYFSGRLFGKHKLAPKLSPGKTWQGVIGGMIMVSILALIVVSYTGFAPFNRLGVFMVSLVVFVFSVFGDLFESMLKRERGIKDSGNILPGHGGVLDRLDSLIAAAPIFAMLWQFATGF